MSVTSIAVALTIWAATPAVRAADREDFNPYRAAKVGDFATYKTKVTLGPLSTSVTTTKTITANDKSQVTLDEVVDDGKTKHTESNRVPCAPLFDPRDEYLGRLDSTSTKDNEGEEKIKINGKEYKANWISYKIEAKDKNLGFSGGLKIWFSNEVPLGVLKMVMTGNSLGAESKTEMELSDSGHKE